MIQEFDVQSCPLTRAGHLAALPSVSDPRVLATWMERRPAAALKGLGGKDPLVLTNLEDRYGHEPVDSRCPSGFESVGSEQEQMHPFFQGDAGTLNPSFLLCLAPLTVEEPRPLCSFEHPV